MIVLAIDTALSACSAALLDSGYEGFATDRVLPMARGHAEALMPMLGELLGEGGLELSDIDRFAVTIGPGTFTGVRVGVATVRGFALVTGKPAVGINTLAALAASARLAAPAALDSLVAAIDARRGEVYAQCFAQDGTPLSEPIAAPADTILASMPREVSQAFGSGADALVAAAQEAGLPLEFLGRDPAPNPAAIARLALEMEPGTPPSPLYLRAPDAKPQQSAAMPRR